MSDQAISAASRMKKIRASYIRQLPDQLEKIKQGYDALAKGDSLGAAPEDLHRALHNLRGSSASFGLRRLSAAVAYAELLAKEAMQTGNYCSDTWYCQMNARLASIENALFNLDVSRDTNSHAIELVAAAQHSRGREQKTIYLCEDDAFQRLTLANQIECFGFRVESFGELEQLRRAVNNIEPDAIVIDQHFPGQPYGGADAMADIQSGREKELPTVFISINGEFSSRLAGVRAGSDAFFVKPINVTELCATLNSLTSVNNLDPYRILIVEDDPHLLELYASILNSAGMITKTLSDPLQVLGPLFEFKPDLILTDMNMPGCSGMELAKVIKQIGVSFSIPIVYLSTETDADKQSHAIRMGGDEFLTKPISPEHLITAVAVRAERMKIIRSSMVRDGMTGLFNHTSTKEHLDLAIAQSRRNGKDLCFAMIDVDQFKRVNDAYGHPVGDQVLITLARLLRQRLRETDVVGRYGGEEFAVILPDCDITAAVQLIDQLRESFGAIRFPVGNELFTSTFSSGIASLSSHEGAAQLCNAADKALYAAKHGGRNCVVAV